MMDLDGFKKVNDVYGHDYGDRVLKQFADILRASIRETDQVFRYGVTSSCCWLTPTRPSGGGNSPGLREAVKDWTASDEIVRGVDVSIGMSMWEPEQAVTNIEEMIKEADRKMYVEKKQHKQALGGNVI